MRDGRPGAESARLLKEYFSLPYNQTVVFGFDAELADAYEDLVAGRVWVFQNFICFESEEGSQRKCIALADVADVWTDTDSMREGAPHNLLLIRLENDSRVTFHAGIHTTRAYEEIHSAWEEQSPFWQKAAIVLDTLCSFPGL
eukprot:tig00001428_g8729.t1